MTKSFLSGCQSAAFGAMLARVQVVAAYPITPQTSIVESLAASIADGQLQAQMVHVESEHSAMSACVGAAVVGARPFTATSGQGLAYMQEPVFWAAGLRLPIVMVVVNRSLIAPNTIFCDHQDSLAQRDSGWIQLYSESCQEVLDNVILAYKIAENEQVLLPVMVCLDGFFLSHLYEPVEIPSQSEVDAFLPRGTPRYPTLDPRASKLLNVLAPPDYYTEFEYDKHQSLVLAAGHLEEASAAFQRRFGRDYHNLESYYLAGAELIVVAMGSMVGTAKAVVRQLRAQGKLVGLVKVKTFRPFPSAELADLLKGAKAVGVLDRDISYGSTGILFQEVTHSLYNNEIRPSVVNFVVGLGGRDVGEQTIRRGVEELERVQREGGPKSELVWLDANHNLLASWGWEMNSGH